VDAYMVIVRGQAKACVAGKKEGKLVTEGK
jgi:hypothetical protein